MSGRPWERLVVAAAGGIAAFLIARVTARAGTASRWRRRNFRDREVSLTGGAAAVVVVVAGCLLVAAARASLVETSVTDDVLRVAGAMAVVAAAAGGVGLFDDLAGDPRSKGFRGHLRALREGRVTSGLVKVVVIVAAAAVGAIVLGRGEAGPQQVVDAGVIAGTANMANLLDLRPGRALKALLVTGAPLCAATAPAVGLVIAWPVGVTVGLLPDDLRERTMLGDGGANALGSALGVALAAAGGLATSAVVLLGLVVATAVSEVVSFSRLIEQSSLLRRLDDAGRRP